MSQIKFTMKVSRANNGGWPVKFTMKLSSANHGGWPAKKIGVIAHAADLNEGDLILDSRRKNVLWMFSEGSYHVGTTSRSEGFRIMENTRRIVEKLNAAAEDGALAVYADKLMSAGDARGEDIAKVLSGIKPSCPRALHVVYSHLKRGGEVVDLI